ncbi:hypothetical protein FDZ71_08835, partial [bacterium]
MEQYKDCSLCRIEPRGLAPRCRFCSGQLTGRSRLMHEIKTMRGWRDIGTALSLLMPGAGQFFGGRIITGLVMAIMIPLS